MFSSPVLSVIIPTRNREGLLRECLEALGNQTLAASAYEILVIDDGSSDGTSALCRSITSRPVLRYLYMDHSGISAAKNLGIREARGTIVLFADDDDIADGRLLEEHLDTHRRYPDENVAVLGYTTWSPALAVSPMMEWVNEIGHLLFGYEEIPDGSVLNFEFFWGGRSSCKKALLATHGMFDETFMTIIEDIELGYRLSRVGLRVVLNRQAVSFMNRSMTFVEFCERSERQGEALLLLSQRHDDPVVADYCRRNLVNPDTGENIDTTEALECWSTLQRRLEGVQRRVHDIEAGLDSLQKGKTRVPIPDELGTLYQWTFSALRVRGAARAIGLEAD